MYVLEIFVDCARWPSRAYANPVIRAGLIRHVQISVGTNPLA